MKGDPPKPAYSSWERVSEEDKRPADSLDLVLPAQHERHLPEQQDLQGGITSLKTAKIPPWIR